MTLMIELSSVHMGEVEDPATDQSMTLEDSVITITPELHKDGSLTSPSNEPSNSPLMVQQPDFRLLMIAGQHITKYSSRIFVAGSTLLPGGLPITLQNTVISLALSGMLIYGSTSILLGSQSSATIGTQSSSPHAAGILFSDISISPNGPVQTLDGQVFSLDQWGHLAVGSVSIPSPTSAPDFAAEGITVIAGQTIIPKASGFEIDGTSVYMGGPAVDLDGIVISLGISGTIVIGSSIFRLPELATHSPPPYTIDGLAVQVLPSSLIIIDGITMTPGQPGTDISGSPVSVERGGTLDVGTARLALSTKVANVTGEAMIFEGGQSQKAKVNIYLLFAVTGLTAWKIRG